MSDNSRSQRAVLPEFVAGSVDDFCGRIENLARPYPFHHPEDLSGYACFHQNDYLRLSQRPEVRRAKAEAVEAHGNSYLASSVFSGGGGMDEHIAFRELLAESMRSEDAVLTSSGWAANVGLVDSLARVAGTPIYLDQKAHASLWDGARMSVGRPIMVRHNDPDALERRIRRDGAGIVCIDAFYSNTGSVADVAAYVGVCERTGSVLVLDEAHSMGMVGEGAGGLAVQAGVAERVHFRTVSFSKALGGHGGCIAASRHLVWYLTHRAHSILFSSNCLPCDSAAHRTALGIARSEPGLAANALAMGRLMRRELSLRGVDTGTSACQIVPVEVDGEPAACRLNELLRRRGILGAVFVQPAMPEGRGMLRFTLHALATSEEVVRAADAVADALDEMGIARNRGQAAA